MSGSLVNINWENMKEISKLMDQCMCYFCQELGDYVQAKPTGSRLVKLERRLCHGSTGHNSAASSGPGAVPVLRRAAPPTHRVMSLPARPLTFTRNPFPELSSPGAVTSPSQSCHIYLDTSARSTPSSSPPGYGHAFPDNITQRISHGVCDSSSTLLSTSLSMPTGFHSIDNDGYSPGSEMDIHNEQVQETHSQHVAFYMDDDNYRSLPVDVTTQACDVCHALVERNNVRDDINWTVVEYNEMLKHERILEDHELILATQKQWPNPGHFKFIFRKDFRKYEVFRNPANFIPLEMVEAHQLQDTDMFDLIPADDQYNQILLQHIFTTCKLPDIHGQCYLRDKKSWKKVHLLLRQTGLYYSTKGANKDSKHLQALSSLGDVNIYTVLDGDRSIAAPAPYCLCLKRTHVTEMKDMVLLSMDEKSVECWHAVLRLIKYGSRLREDYKSAVNDLEKSLEKETCLTTSNTDAHPQRVAMDFSGTRGRVVEDPNEALAAATEEASQWRKKITSRKVTPGLDESARPSFLTNTSRINQQFTQGLGAGVHVIQPWFHSGIMRQQAVDLIAKHGLIDGVFLVRESHTIQEAFVLSLAHNHKVKHCQILKYSSDGLAYFSLDGGHTKFTDLIQLVEFYQLNAAGLPTCLTHYVTSLV